MASRYRVAHITDSRWRLLCRSIFICCGLLISMTAAAVSGDWADQQASAVDAKVVQWVPGDETSSGHYGNMETLTDQELGAVSGQALLVADSFNGAEFGGDPAHTFMRMSLDAEVEMSMNIDHLQLGCGGFNSQLAGAANACDVDIEYVGFMGQGAGQPGAPGAGDPTSGFLLRRPYLEFVVEGNDDPATREIVGLKIGAQRAQGFMSIGRFIEGDITLTTGGTHDCTRRPNNIECHRGINRLSGWLDLTLQGEAYGCFGLFAGCTPAENQEDQQFLASFNVNRQVYGTRMSRAYFGGVTMNSFLGLDLTANINAALRYVHGTVIDATEASPADFFISFQREPVVYPNFAKNQPSQQTNTGWWMNIPDAAMTGLVSYDNSTSTGDAFGSINYSDIDFGQRPAKNCWGDLQFC